MEMSVLDWTILIVNVACLIGSIVSAVKASGSYRKCKQLTNFANLKRALDECQLIYTNIYKLLKLCGKNANKNRGINIEKEASEYGNAIKNSFAKIKEILPADSQKEVDDLLTRSSNPSFDIEKYVSTLISGSAVNNNTLTDDNVYMIQKAVENIQLHIKRIMEEMQDDEKKM